MQYDPSDSPYQRAADRMPAAHDLIAKRRFREALDILNTAIVVAPTYPIAYALRAQVFDNLGLTEQAEADRQRERELAATEGYPVADIVDGVATITMRRVDRRVGGAAQYRHSNAAGSRIGAILSPVVFGVLILIGVIAAGAGGVMLALDSFDDNDSAVFQPGGPSPSAAAATSTPSPTEEPTPEVDVTGDPFSLSSVTDAWEDAGLTVTVEGPSEEFTGFENSATDVSTSSGEFSVFVYEDSDSTADDWSIVDASRPPTPKEGRSFPPSESVWFYSNIIVVVWSTTGDAEFDAFIDMTP